MRKNWLKLGLGTIAACSLIAGVCTLNTTQTTSWTASAAATAQDITELDMCDNAKPGDDGQLNVGSDSAFNFNTVQSVATGEHRIHVEGNNYWSFDTATKYFDISFQMEFSDWGDDGYMAFNTAGNNQLRIYNHKMETKALVGTQYEGRHQELAFTEEITSGWHTVRMVLDAQGATNSAGHNTFTAKVVIDGVETSYDWYAEDWGGNAYYLLNNTGVAVNVLSSNVEAPEEEPDEEPIGEVTFTEVPAQDIADMLISDGALGSAGAETAFTFATGDSVTATENRIHTAGSGYWGWDTALKEINVNFKLEFTDWNDGWFGFKTSATTELRIFNDKIEIYADGESKGTTALAGEITSGYHTVNMTYQLRKSVESGETNGSRLTVTIDDAAYTVTTKYYPTYGGHASLLYNATGVAVNVLSTNALAPDEEPEGEMTFTEVAAQDIADMDISDGARGSVQNPLNFNEIDEVAAKENRIHYKGQNHYQWDVQTREINVNFHLEFTEWNGGWFGFKTAGNTELRIYNDKIEIFAEGSSNGTAAFASEIKLGYHSVNMTYQFRKAVETGEVNGSRLTVTIDGVAYEVKTNYYPTYQGHVFMLINATGDPVNVLSAKQDLPEVTYTKVKKQAITDLYVADGANTFNFSDVQDVQNGVYGLFTSDSYDTEDTVSLGKDVTMKVQFGYWGEGYLGFNLSNASVRIYNDKIAIYSRNANGEYVVEEGVTVLDTPVYSGWHTVRVVYQNKYVKGVAEGSRLQVIIDGTTYTVECDYINEAGVACQMVNTTGTTVQITNQNTTTLKDLSDWWIINNALRNNGYAYQAGAENAFNFLNEESVAKGGHIFHDNPNYWSIAITYATGGFEFIMSFDGWNVAGTEDEDGNPITEDGYFAIKIGTTTVRIYDERAELYSSSDNVLKDTVSFGKAYTGKQDVTVLIAAAGAGTKATLTIGADTYVLESDIAPATTHSQLINNTGTTVTIQSQLKKKTTAFVESYIDFDNYYEREVETAYALIETALAKINTASSRSSIDGLVASLCKKLDALPTKADVDAMIAENVAYKNTVTATVETKVGELDQESFTSAQWTYLQEAKQVAMEQFNVARNAEETDAIAETFFAEIQLMVEDATKLAFYASDITERLQKATAGSELTTTLQNALTAIEAAGFATDVEDTYLAAVLAAEGDGESEYVPGDDLQEGGDFEKIETSEDDSNSNSSDDSVESGCASSMDLSLVAIVVVLVLAIFVLRRKNTNE